MIVVLDAGPLGLASNPKVSGPAGACNDWVNALLARGVRVAVPEICDYEVRRELIRARRLRGIKRLDRLKVSLRYVPLTTEMVLLAAEFWARLRQQGRPTADPHDLDCDVILAAQAAILAEQMDEPVVIATTNVGHLAGLVPARQWQEIDPAQFD